MKEFCVVDLSPQCDVRSTSMYSYALLEQINGASELLGTLSSHLWRNENEFELLLLPTDKLTLRWRASSDGVGILTLFDPKQTYSLSIVASGKNLEAERVTFEAFHRHILQGFHDTGTEPSFEVLQIERRPLLATVGFFAPAGPAQQMMFAMSDRCFAAAYFRKHALA